MTRRKRGLWREGHGGGRKRKPRKAPPTAYPGASDLGTSILAGKAQGKDYHIPTFKVHGDMMEDAMSRDAIRGDKKWTDSKKLRRYFNKKRKRRKKGKK